MKTLSLKYYPDKVLTTLCEPCELSTFDLKETVLVMEHILNKTNGLGLSAPQVGLSTRLFITRDFDAPTGIHVFINPLVVEQGPENAWSLEGCLSLPNIQGKIKRSDWIHVTYETLDGTTMHRKLMNLEACCIQHELDHLNGILFVDRSSSVQRRLLLDKYFKRSKQYARIRG